MEEKNQNIEESNKKDLTQEEIEDVQGGINPEDFKREDFKPKEIGIEEKKLR